MDRYIGRNELDVAALDKLVVFVDPNGNVWLLDEIDLLILNETK